MPSSACKKCADRKSTRLNSSHTIISYAVFCLKKNERTQRQGPRPCDTARSVPPAPRGAGAVLVVPGARVGVLVVRVLDQVVCMRVFFKLTGGPQDLPFSPPGRFAI